MLRWLTHYVGQPSHRVVGLMSGTSVDGIDAALVEITGSGSTLRAQLQHFVTVPFPDEIRQRILNLCEGGSVTEVTKLNVVLGASFADAVLHLLGECGLQPTAIDLIGSHGQTVCHLPDERATLQIGEPCVIAERTGVTTVAEFRYRDMAAGGQGAPLVPYVDYLLLRRPTKNRIIHNIGGIANLTLLRAGATLDDVLAFDSGPGNMIIDECVRVLTHGTQEFDEGGRLAAQGKVDEAWLTTLMKHPFFHRASPKSAGREEFGRAFAEAFIRDGKRRGLADYDIIATATTLTAESMVASYRVLGVRDFEVILGGGGAFNPVLRRMLQERLAPQLVLTHEDCGIRSDAKEAIAFAILAHETIMGAANNVPGATGAARHVILGKIVPGLNR
jgi:anhydro-N-acetylmuramic acid kinase